MCACAILEDFHRRVITTALGPGPPFPPPTVVRWRSPPVPYAVIFPGQGAAAPGAGRAWVDHRAWEAVAEAEAVLDRPVARLLLEADAAELGATGASQLAVLLRSEERRVGKECGCRWWRDHEEEEDRRSVRS